MHDIMTNGLLSLDQFEELVPGGFSHLLDPPNDWNPLKIVILSDRVWFLVNGYVASLDDATVEWAFTNFSVYSLKQAGAQKN